MNNKKIVLASNNKKKMKEMTELMAPFGVEVISQGSLNISPAEEPFHTFLEIHWQKHVMLQKNPDCRLLPMTVESA